MATLFTICRGESLLGLRYKNRSYIVAFKSLELAHEARNELGVQPRLWLTKKRALNSLLTLDKRNFTGPDTSAHVAELDFKEALMYPFQKCVGVVIPNNIVCVNHDKAVYNSWVLDPCDFDVCSVMQQSGDGCKI